MARSSGLDEVRPLVMPEVVTERRFAVRLEAARSGSAMESVPAVVRDAFELGNTSSLVLPRLKTSPGF